MSVLGPHPSNRNDIHQRPQPIDWGKAKGSQSEESFDVATPQKAASTSTDSAGSSSQIKTQATPSIAEPYTRAELMAAVKLLGKGGYDYQIAQMLLEYGVSLSEDSFEQLSKLLKGRKDTKTVQAAVVALSKGLKELPESVDFLSKFLSQKSNNSSHIEAFQNNIQAFQKSLMGKGFDPSLMQQLSVLVGMMDEDLHKLINKDRKSTLLNGVIKRGNMISNLHGIHQLLDGLGKKYDQNLSQEFKASLGKFQGSIKEFMGYFVSQLILSKVSDTQSQGLLESFAYWQIPNFLAENPRASMMDLLIKKDPKDPKTIDEQKTKVILSFYAPLLGKIVVLVVIQGKNVWYSFKSEDAQTVKHVQEFQKDLIEQMETVGYHLKGFHSVQGKENIEDFILPKQNLDELQRVDTQI